VVLKVFLQDSCPEGFLSLADHTRATSLFELSYGEVEYIALSMGIIPLRYQRNQSTISPTQQKILFDSHIAIIGCGGLGGHVAEILTRIGIGKLTLCDFDSFEEHNLNRQNFSTIADLGRNKVTVVKEGLQKINPSITIETIIARFDPRIDMPKIRQATLVIDALDAPRTKKELAAQCHEQGIHFVHGAIAGMHGQFATDSTLEHLYPSTGSGAEIESGNPAFTVTLAASIQASEAIKTILHIGEPLKDEFMLADLFHNEFEKLPL